MGTLLYGDAIHIREQAKIDAARITQKSGNERRGAETALQQFSASLANQRNLDAAGKQINASHSNVARTLSAATSGTLMGRIQAAEELGAMASSAAAAGVGGSSVEAYNQTMRLSRAMQEEQQERSLNSDLIANTTNAGEALVDATATLDNGVYRANLDFTQYVDHKKMGTFEKFAWLTTAATATVFGGPQAGMAVASLAEGKQAAMNGDYAAATQAQMGAVQNGFSAGKSFHLTGGNYWSGASKAASTDPSSPIPFNSAAFINKYGLMSGFNLKG